MHKMMRHNYKSLKQSKTVKINAILSPEMQISNYKNLLPITPPKTSSGVVVNKEMCINTASHIAQKHVAIIVTIYA